MTQAIQVSTQTKDERIKELEEQLLVQSYVISYFEGGLTLVAKRLNGESRIDLLPAISKAVEQHHKRLFHQKKAS